MGKEGKRIVDFDQEGMKHPGLDDETRKIESSIDMRHIPSSIQKNVQDIKELLKESMKDAGLQTVNLQMMFDEMKNSLINILGYYTPYNIQNLQQSETTKPETTKPETEKSLKKYISNKLGIESNDQNAMISLFADIIALAKSNDYLKNIIVPIISYRAPSKYRRPLTTYHKTYDAVDNLLLDLGAGELFFILGMYCIQDSDFKLREPRNGEQSELNSKLQGLQQRMNLSETYKDFDAHTLYQQIKKQIQNKLSNT